MGSYTIKKGHDIRIEGEPEPAIVDAVETRDVAVYPADHFGIKARLLVKEGDTVKRGTPLVFHKKQEAFCICSPAAGTVKAIDYGKRRMISRIVVECADKDEAEPLKDYKAGAFGSLSRDEILLHLQNTGLIVLLQQRPFSRTANPEAKPKSIFVNAMNTGPFQPDANVVIKDHGAEFQAGLDLLTRLTEGKVHLCLDGSKDNLQALTGARNVEVHTFTGPHPAGNTSVHIHHIDPISPGDTIWTVKAVDLVLIGELFLKGEMPASRVISAAGPGLPESARKYYRVHIGGSLDGVLGGTDGSEPLRVVSGDALSGTRIPQDRHHRLSDAGLTVLKEDDSRLFMGWAGPGFGRYSLSPTYLSTWFKRKTRWALGTSLNGEHRPMVLTGIYDKYMPLNIMTDFLVRAVLARDGDEMIALGILETDPEDFALCAFACPSKMDLCGVIRRGLDQIEKEGI